MAIFFTEAPEVEEIAAQIVPTTHPHLTYAKMRYVFRSEHTKSQGREIWATANLLTGRTKFLSGGYDFLIDVAEDVWNTLSTEQKFALIDHKLCHCVVGEKEAWAIQGHDIEEFTAIIDRHGLWSDAAKEFAAVVEERVWREIHGENRAD